MKKRFQIRDNLKRQSFTGDNFVSTKFHGRYAANANFRSSKCSMYSETDLRLKDRISL